MDSKFLKELRLFMKEPITGRFIMVWLLIIYLISLLDTTLPDLALHAVELFKKK